MAAILIVDDDAYVRRVLERLIIAQGFAAVATASGHEALAVLARGNIDAVVLDVDMPEMCGEDVLRSIRAGGRRVPVIVFSGTLDEAHQGGHLVELGATRVCAKPDFQRLLAHLSEVVPGGA